MNKITSKADARALAEKLVTDYFTIQLWDDVNGNRLIHCEGSTGYNQQYKMLLTNTVKGIEYRENMSIYTITEALYCARKFINNSGQLDQI